MYKIKKTAFTTALKAAVKASIGANMAHSIGQISIAKVDASGGATLNIAAKASADLKLVTAASLGASLNTAIKTTAELKSFVDVTQNVAVQGMTYIIVYIQVCILDLFLLTR